MSDLLKPQGKKSKGEGSKDAKRSKTNKNLTSALPDRAKEAALEDAAAKSLSERETVFEPWQRQVIRLQSQGWSLTAIINKGIEARRNVKGGKGNRRGYARLPGVTKLFESLRERPEFRETCRTAFAFSVDAIAQETLLLFRSLDQIPGLKGRDLVDARYKRGIGTLNVAGRIVPGVWGEQSDVEREVIVMEVGGGWIPTRTISGVVGQGREAEEAAERWKKLRADAKDA